MRDRLPGLAAEIAFWVLLSLPALLLTAIAAASVVLEGTDWQAQLIDRIVEVSRVALTENTIDELVVPVLEGLVDEGGFALVSTAAVATVWTASRAVRVVLTTLTIVYDSRDPRPGWQDRLLGFAITVAAVLFGLIIAPLLVAGPAFGETIQSWTTLDLDPLPTLWRSVYWPLVVVIAALAISLLYHLGVPGRTRWIRALPGAAVATGAWLAGSAGLRLYGMWVATGESTYGPLAGPVVVLLWLWLSGFAVLLGGELNAQIEVVWPRDHHEPDVEVLVSDAHAGDLDDPDDQPTEELTRPIKAPPGPRS